MPKQCPECSASVNDYAGECVCGYRFRDGDIGQGPSTTSDTRHDKNEAFVELRSAGGRLPSWVGAGPLPEPLADPLRGLRSGLIGLNWFGAMLTAVLVLVEYAAGSLASAVLSLIAGVVGVIWLYGITRLLPDRPTDILYLRSFRTDDETGGIRTSLERALEPEFRVSGIRDPKRRWPGIIRFMSYLLFALKYANPRYLNLEAGDEWKARLWRSLGEARGVVIDIADLTPFVEAEIRLCAKCMGLQRILFVIREFAEPAVWKGRISQALGVGNHTDEIQLAVWNVGWDRKNFEAQVAAFGSQLPPKPAGFDPAARSLAEQLPGQQFRESSDGLRAEIAIGLFAGVLGTAALSALPQVHPGVGLVVVPFYFVWYVLLAIHYTSFRRNSGSWRRRRIAFWTVGPMLLSLPLGLLFGMFLPAVQKVSAAAARMKSSNNLKQIGLAMHNYSDANWHLPPANAPFGSNSKTPPVSWRILLLPYLDEGERSLYKQYKFDEPWDGPNNSQLLAQMPAVYRHPAADPKKVPVGHTYYRAFASRPGAESSAVFVDGQQGPKLTDLADGTSNTILVVEAAEAVPWTMPEILLFDRNQPLPKLGGLFSGGYNAVLGDGSVRFFRDTLPEDRLRAWITKDGGEIVGDDW